MSQLIDFDFSNDETLRCRGKEDTDKAKAEGEYFGNILISGRVWAVVLWDDDEDPDLYKAECLLIEEKAWRALQT